MGQPADDRVIQFLGSEPGRSGPRCRFHRLRREDRTRPDHRGAASVPGRNGRVVTVSPTVDVLERTERAVSDKQAYVTLTVAGQLCGIPVLGVRDILAEQPITRIPLAPPDIAGSLNLRGRIVTAIDLRRRLNLPPP